MPNGGSDCCGTCWFNAKNKGEPGYQHSSDRDPDFCVIRDLDLAKSPAGSFYTYCANHPHRNPDKLRVPLGPVFVGDEDGDRRLWVPSPDTEEVRTTLVRLLEEMPERPKSEYPHGIYRDELVIWQLGEFREARARPGLERIAGLRPGAPVGPFGRTRQTAIAAAKAALARIEGREA
jgi:hypothetical protein